MSAIDGTHWRGNALTLRFPPSPHENGPDQADWWGALLQRFHVMTMVKEEAAFWAVSSVSWEETRSRKRRHRMLHCETMRNVSSNYIEWVTASFLEGSRGNGAQRVESQTPKPQGKPWPYQWMGPTCLSHGGWKWYQGGHQVQGWSRDGDRAVVVRGVWLLCNRLTESLEGPAAAAPNSVGLSLWVAIPSQGHQRTLQNIDTYIMIHNSAKLQLWSSNERNFMVGDPTVLKVTVLGRLWFPSGLFTVKSIYLLKRVSFLKKCII